LETKVKSKVLEEFKEVAKTLTNPAVKEWKKQGGKVIGYFCTAVPEEMITAAGMLPYRMRATGSTGTELSDAYYSSVNCSFPRHCLNQALRGEFDFVDGIMCSNSCDHVRRIYDNWKRQIKTPFIDIMSLPRKVEEPQIEWYYDELNRVRENLEKHFGIKITDESIKKSIKLHNEVHVALRQLYELRKRENPPISGTDVMAVVVASTAMPRERFLGMIRELLDELRDADGISDYRGRLMIIGGILDDPEYVKVIEDIGGLVVTDSLCYGSRLFWVDVNEEISDPIRALAEYYVHDRPSCPRTYGEQPRRLEYTLNMIRDFKVDGVILERMAFCDIWLVENYMYGLDLKEKEVPFLKLDREYILSGVGQLRTRVQAFLETMGR